MFAAFAAHEYVCSKKKPVLTLDRWREKSSNYYIDDCISLIYMYKIMILLFENNLN